MDEQANYRTLSAQIEALDHAAASKNIDNYENALSGAVKTCDKSADLSKRAFNFFENADKKVAVGDSCDRLNFLLLYFNKHRNEYIKMDLGGFIYKGRHVQKPKGLYFQLKTIEKLW